METFNSALTSLLLKKQLPLQTLPTLLSSPSSLTLYLSLPLLRHHLSTNPLNQTFSSYFHQLPSSLSTTQSYQLLNLSIWKQPSQQQDITLKSSCTYYRLLTEWITLFENTISKPEAINLYFHHLLEFINTKTSTYLERVVFIEEIYDDIKQTIQLKHFWGEVKEDVVIGELETTVENLDSLLGVLEIITFKSVVKFSRRDENSNANTLKDVWLYSPLLSSLDSSSKYDEFVFRGLSYILLHPSMLHKVEKNLTQTILRFVTWTTNNQYTLHLLKQCVLHTSKAVKFALLSQYQLVFQIFEHQERQELIEELEEIYEIRELIKKKVESQVIEFPQHERNSVIIGSSEQKVFFFEVTKPSSIVFLQLYVDLDITVTLSYIGGTSGEQINSQYLKQQKCKNKTFQILVNDCGLHAIRFDNTYSWMTSKNVVFSLNVLKVEEGEEENNEWNLLVYGEDEFTRLDRGKLGEVKGESEEEKKMVQIWGGVGEKADLVIWKESVMFQGRVMKLEELELSKRQVRGIKTIVIVGEEEEYKDVEDDIKEGNPNVQIKRCNINE